MQAPHSGDRCPVLHTDRHSVDGRGCWLPWSLRRHSAEGDTTRGASLHPGRVGAKGRGWEWCAWDKRCCCRPCRAPTFPAPLGSSAAVSRIMAEAPTEEARRRVVIALDGSEQSNEAFGFAVAKVLRPGRDRVILLHVLAPGQYEAEAQEHLKDFQDFAQDSGLEAQMLTAQGDAKHAIVSVAEEEGADLIVVGSHGKGMAKRLLLGSVSDFCAHNACCPVLVHRGPPKN